MRGFNRIPEFIKKISSKKYRTCDKVGKFCKGKMDFYVAVDTGYLRSRNTYKITGWKEPKLKLVNDCYYAIFQEYGTKYIPEHPFIRPAMFNHLSEIKSIVGGEWSGF